MARIYVTCRVFADEIERLRAAEHDVTVRTSKREINRSTKQFAAMSTHPQGDWRLHGALLLDNQCAGEARR